MNRNGNNILVCDIDNTVSSQLQRYCRFYSPAEGRILPQAFDEQEISRDEPLLGAVEALNRLTEKFRIVWLSARPPYQYEMTRKWLIRNGFPRDELILVDKRNDKIPVLIDIRPYVYIDDMKYNYENIDPRPTTEFMRCLDENGIRYEVFRNNWVEIADKYLGLIKIEEQLGRVVIRK
jgi:hypothetical protein